MGVIGVDPKKDLRMSWWISAIQNISQEIWISSAEKIHVHNASCARLVAYDTEQKIAIIITIATYSYILNKISFRTVRWIQ